MLYWVEIIPVNKGVLLYMRDTSFDSLIDEYLVYCRSRELREKTMNSYEQSLLLFERRCMDELNICSADKITEPIIRHYITSIQERGKYSFYCNEKQKDTNKPERRRDYRKPVSTTTINNYIRNLKAFFNWLDSDYIIKKNPMKKVKPLRTERKMKEYLTDEEFKRLISTLDKSYYNEFDFHAS